MTYHAVPPVQSILPEGAELRAGQHADFVESHFRSARAHVSVGNATAVLGVYALGTAAWQMVVGFVLDRAFDIQGTYRGALSAICLCLIFGAALLCLCLLPPYKRNVTSPAFSIHA
jgi:MFS family permease